MPSPYIGPGFLAVRLRGATNEIWLTAKTVDVSIRDSVEGYAMDPPEHVSDPLANEMADILEEMIYPEGVQDGAL
jgi:hypothetical protein